MRRQLQEWAEEYKCFMWTLLEAPKQELGERTFEAPQKIVGKETKTRSRISWKEWGSSTSTSQIAYLIYKNAHEQTLKGRAGCLGKIKYVWCTNYSRNAQKYVWRYWRILVQL